MLESINPLLEELYDGSGRHLGGIFPPLMVANVTTDHHRAMTAIRPKARLIGGGSDPHGCLGVVWMVPVPSNPLLLSSHVLGALVQTLDRGFSVLIQADCDAAIQATIEHVAPLLGGGHA